MKKIILTSLFLSLSTAAFAQEEGDKNRFERHANQHQERQENFKERRQQRYENASPKQKELMDARREKYQNASPQEKKEMHEKLKERHQERAERRGDLNNAPPPPPHHRKIDESRDFRRETFKNSAKEENVEIKEVQNGEGAARKRFFMKKGAEKLEKSNQM
jgi:hypothetical protein